MTLSIKKLHPTFAGEAGQIDLRDVTDEAAMAEIRSAMDEYALLVFRDQKLNNEDQVDFARRLGGKLHTNTGSKVLQKSRFSNDAVSDVSNVDAEGALLDPDDRRRLQGLGNRLWHTDASFHEPSARYSTLSAHVLPPDPPDTEFADMRAAYDALPEKRKEELDGLSAYHSIAYSRATLGFEFTKEEQEKLGGRFQPVVRSHPGSNRKALYLGSYASMIEGMPVPEGRLILHELMEHATKPQFVFSHSWRLKDLVIWDNRATLHRATAFDDKAHAREMRRVATLDVDSDAPRTE